jgi:hypothetical protein
MPHQWHFPNGARSGNVSSMLPTVLQALAARISRDTRAFRSRAIHRPAAERAHLPRLAAFAAAWVLALVVLGVVLAARGGWLADARVYWAAWHGPLYGGGFVYPPAGALLFAPAAVLPWPVFAALWTGLLIVCGAWLLWPLPPYLRLPLFVALAATLVWCNAATLVAVALALAPRWPAAWAVIAWTKVTPAIGMAALVRRRQWRGLGVAVAASAALGIGVLVLAPEAFGGWVAQLARHPEIPSYWIAMLPVTPPLWLRLALAALVAWFGTSRPWTLALAAAIATPDLSLATCGILAALPRLATSAHTSDECA